VLGHDSTLTILIVAGLAACARGSCLGLARTATRPRPEAAALAMAVIMDTQPVEQPGLTCPTDCPITPVPWMPLVPRQGNHREQNAR
jgi:hypothetical protein